MREHRHLSRWADPVVLVADREKPDAVAESRGDIGGPGLELRAIPFEPVILVPKLSRRQRRPLHVVFRVRRRHGDRARPSRLEHDSLERPQPGLVEVLDDFHDRCRVETLQPRVAIHERTVHEADPFTLLRCEAIEFEPRLRQIERAAGDVHAGDLGELAICEQPAQELAFAATEIEHPRGARCLQHVEDRIEPAVVETDRAFD